MTSEIRVNKIENRSGLGTVTFADTGVDLAGIVTATTFSGSGASLTDLPAASLTGTVADARISTVTASKLSGALPALDGSALTGVASTENIRTNTNATFLQNINVSGITTVGSAVTISESGIEASGIGITCANLNGGQIGGRRNLIINGAMNVAQRGTSSTDTTNGYYTVDRFRYSIGGHDEAATHAQVDVASGTDPYKLGFRKAFKVTNGNQTSGAGASDHIQIDYYVEAQDIANSGWDITNPNSFLTVSLWMKASVSQFYTFAIRCKDGTEQVINFKTPVLSANTWTKVIKRIPGNSNLTVDNDNGRGFQFMFFPYIGTSYSTVGLAEDTWSSWASAKHAVPNTTTWWETDDATWEITGLQLEVGSQATAFEHRSFGDELALCQRYFQQIGGSGQDGTYTIASGYLYGHGSYMATGYTTPVTMRATPTITQGSTGLQCKTSSSTVNISSYNFIETVFPSTYISISGQNASDAGNENELCLWVNPTNGSTTLAAEL